MGPIRKHYVMFASLLGCAVIAVAFFINQLHSASTEINRRWLPGAIHVGQINMLTSDFRINELQHVLSTQDHDMAVYEQRMDGLLKQINGELSAYESLIRTDAQRRLYEDFLGKWQEYLAINRSMIALSRENRNMEATSILRARSETLFNEYSGTLSLLVADKRHAADRQSETNYWIFVGSLVNVLFIAGLAGYFLYKMSRQMRSLLDKVVATCVNIMAQTTV